MNVKLKCIFHLKVKYKMIVKNKINKCFKPCFWICLCFVNLLFDEKAFFSEVGGDYADMHFSRNRKFCETVLGCIQRAQVEFFFFFIRDRKCRDTLHNEKLKT